MSVEVHILEGPLPTVPPRWRTGAGAFVRFEGLVRPLEVGQLLEGLFYEDYEPMTRRHLERLAGEMVKKHHLTALIVEHSRGRVGVGGCSFRLDVLSERRKAAFQATEEFIDRMKQSIPIWKVPIWASENPSEAGVRHPERSS